MRSIYIFIIFIGFLSCEQVPGKVQTANPIEPININHPKTYDQIKDSILLNQKRFFQKYGTLQTAQNELTNYWVRQIVEEMYPIWEHTPWDFNGTTNLPKQGAIACGFFVTTVLRDMGVNINRTKLAVCASSLMMKQLTPRQKIKNLSQLSYPAFNDEIKKLGKGVYIIGLDFHTGFIVNDGIENWFIHSNYIRRQGVVKETILNSSALKSSKTRWMISLTNDLYFMNKWLSAK